MVKLGGDVLVPGEVLDSVTGQLALLSSLGIRIVVVHGGGPQATALSRRLGFEPRMVAGRRVTDDGALEVAKLVYAGQINVDLLSALREHRVQAVGLSGVDAELITAHRRPPVSVVDDSGTTMRVDYGHVGDVDRVDPRVLVTLLEARMMPVVASLAGGEDGQVYNVNADTVAESLAVALRAQKLIYLTGAPGVLRDRNDPSTLITFADPDDLAGLMANGALGGGMRPKVEACIRAATGGVERTHIIDGRAPDALLAGGLHRSRMRNNDRRPQGKGDVSGSGPCRVRSTCCGSSSPSHRSADRRRTWQSSSRRPPAAGGSMWSRNSHGVRVEVRGWGAGPTIVLASHLDVVPPGAGWTRDPFTPAIEGTRLYGRGSGDAKASVAAMLYAARDIVDSGGMDVGRLLVLLGYGEETKNTTMGGAVEEAGEIDAAVIGEPTGLDFAIAQRGLLMVDLLAQGDQRHAAYAGGEDGFTNAVQILARDLIKLDSAFQARTHPVLGKAMATATMIEAGVSRNITPPVARAVLDIRSTPDWTHEELASELRAFADQRRDRNLTPPDTV